MYVLDCPRIRRDLQKFLHLSCAVPGLSWFYSPVASIWQTRVCDIPDAQLQGWKLVIDKTTAQSRACFWRCDLRCYKPECILLPYCFHLASLGVRCSRRTPSGLDCSHSKRHSYRLFCSCKLCCCRAECILLLGFNVQFFAVMIAWL